MTEAQSQIGRRRQAARSDGSEEYSAKRRELIRVAATVFKEKGYEAATLNDVAQRFGADRATLYYYIGSKEELFREAVRGVLETNLEAAEEIVARDADPREKLRALVEQMLLSYEENYPQMYLYIQEDMRRVTSEDTPWARDMTRQTRRLESIAIKLIREGVEQGIFRGDVPVKLASNALFGMLNWTHRWFRPGGELSGPELVDAFSVIFFDGMLRRS
jgi:AcrR family transcriptional regulator